MPFEPWGKYNPMHLMGNNWAPNQMKTKSLKKLILFVSCFFLAAFVSCNPDEPQPGNGGNGGGNGGGNATDNPTSVPTVIIESIASPNPTTATVNASITNTGNGLIQERGIVYYTSESDTLVTLRSDSNDNQFSLVMGNLNNNLMYYVKAYADNTLGTGYSEITMFTPGRPVVEIDITEVTKTTISVKTKISNFDGNIISEKGICYGQSADLTYYNAENITYQGNEDEFFINLTGLTSGDKYYIRSYVKSNGELTYSPVVDTLTIYPWHYVTDIPGLPRTQAVSFAIGSKAYIGTGVYQNDMYLEDMWEYDTETGVWTQIANYPEGKVRGLTAFAVNGKGYVGLGYRRNGTNEGEKLDSFYEYDPSTNTWTRIHDYPGGWCGYDSRDAFTMNGKGYLVTEMYPTDVPTSPLRGVNIYELNPNTNSWSKVSTFEWHNYNAFSTYSYLSANAVGGNIYCYLRYYNGAAVFDNERQGFLQYDTEFGTWIEKSCPFSITYTKMESFVLGNNFYLFLGNFYGAVHNEKVYKYYPETNTWTDNEVSAQRPFRYHPVKFVIGDKLYYGGGDDNGNHTDLWVYDPSLE